MNKIFRRMIGAAVLSLGVAQPVLAHPHIMIDAKAVVRFDDQGRVAGLRHSWTFDSAFSVWMVQGLDTNGDGTVSPGEMQELADENTVSLADFNFYTYAGDTMRFAATGDQGMVYENNRVTLSFSLDAVTPQPVGQRFELGVYDPEYYVAITVNDASDVTLENAPDGCVVRVEPPVPMAPEVEERLYALGPEVLELPPDLAAAMRGTQGLVVVDCGAAATPATAVDAVSDLAAARPATPFGGPPAEVGIPLPRSGFFGWLQEQQRDFYAALTASLDALRTDWTAFWVLGGLSFLYGIFHAAGPGHGKVVISSYVLANESQLRRGIVLSGLSALMQSMVAIGFVLVLAGVLQLTRTALDGAAYWVSLLSYALVALLGAWLVVRKVFGLGHGQGHGHEQHFGHDEHHHHHNHHNHHDHHHMHHAIGPGDIKSDWREQLGVILAVGLRPCSGALVVLVFALSQGLLAAGIAATLLMGLGTAITVAALATLAVTAKGLAGRIGGADSRLGHTIVWWAELVGALCVLGFGVLLVIASL